MQPVGCKLDTSVLDVVDSCNPSTQVRGLNFEANLVYLARLWGGGEACCHAHNSPQFHVPPTQLHSFSRTVLRRILWTLYSFLTA